MKLSDEQIEHIEKNLYVRDIPLFDALGLDLKRLGSILESSVSDEVHTIQEVMYHIINMKEIDDLERAYLLFDLGDFMANKKAPTEVKVISIERGTDQNDRIRQALQDIEESEHDCEKCDKSPICPLPPAISYRNKQGRVHDTVQVYDEMHISFEDRTLCGLPLEGRETKKMTSEYVTCTKCKLLTGIDL